MWPVKSKASPAGIHCLMTTPRLQLRPPDEGDFAAWRKLRALNESYLRPFEPAWPKDCLTESFYKRRVARISQDWLSDKAYSFLIFEKETTALIGGININNVSRGAAQYASLGYWLNRESQGKGHMTEATNCTVDYAFSVLSLARVNAATLPHNEKSRAMLLRVGFVEEGFAKSYIQIDGRRQDHILYGINEKDFLSAARKAR